MGQERIMAGVVDRLQGIEEERDKLSIFKHDTLDEADPRYERASNSDIRVEIGGPGAHIRLVILTRREHTLLRTAITDIIEGRIKRLNEELDDLCAERIKTKGKPAGGSPNE